MLFAPEAQLWAHLATALLVAATVLWLVWLIRAERQGRRRAQALLGLQAAAMDAAMDAIFITDHAGRLVWCNRAFERLTGWTAAEVSGHGARRILQGDHPADDSLREMRAALAEGRPWRGEVDLRHRDGGLLYVDLTVTPIAGGGGRPRHYVAVLSDLSERRRAEERIHFLSSYDALTSLPNRRLFGDRLERAVARALGDGGVLAVLFLDLDDFGRVNDLLGHDSGDRLLTVVVERLLGVADQAEMVARLGGDEFALLVTGGSAETAAALAQAVLTEVTRPYDLNGHTVHLGASIGIALFPGDGSDAQTLIRNADIAMYRAVREHQGGFRFFSPVMDAELAARRQFEHDLRRAVARGELQLLYQPIVATRSREIVGVEALVRWHRDGGASVPPDDFVARAEQMGLIGAIGDWVLAEACRQARVWSEEGLPAVPVAVNVSAVQVHGEGFVRRVRDILCRTRLPPGRLEIELTESAVVDDAEEAERLLTTIKSLGVRLAMDDFGTGYSSLARLKRFPIDKLKIDKSFVADLATDPGDAAIARAVVSLAHGLGIQVVSEGVETEAQLRYLEQEGCDAVQGFLFSPPVEADRAGELLRRGGFPP